MNEYTIRYAKGDSRYNRTFYTGTVRAGDLITAARKAGTVAIQKGLYVVSVSLVLGN